MASEQVNTVLDHTRRYHEHVSELLAQMAARSDLPRATMLLDYLSGHHRKMAKAIERIEEETPEKVLNTWVQSSEDSAHLAQAVDAHKAPGHDAGFDELMTWSLGLDDRARQVYEDLSQRADPAWLRELFSRMHEMELQEEKLVAVQSLRGMDL